MGIDRRAFCLSAAGSAGLFVSGRSETAIAQSSIKGPEKQPGRELLADLVIIGGGLGGCAAAIAALRNGLRVVMTEETDWIGGQLTAQGVPTDEHRWIETHGANSSYQELRKRIRDYYRRNYPLLDAARSKLNLNPGNGNVSRLCQEPRVALAVLEALLAPYQASGQLLLLTEHRAISPDVEHDQVLAVQVRSMRSGRNRVLVGKYFVDATELGDLLPLTGTEFVTGSEAQSETHEIHAPKKADPNNQQAFTMCFAVDHLTGEDHTIDKPDEYSFWRKFVSKMTPPWPGKLLDFTYTHPRSGKPKRLGFSPTGGRTLNGALNLWTYRRLIDASQFEPNSFPGDISLINWPQNDYVLGNLIGVSEEESRRHIDRAKQFSLSLLYWLQTEAPRPDGGTEFPGLRLRPDIMGTEDGLAKTPYIRESRRIRAEFTVLEGHVGRENRAIMKLLEDHTGRQTPAILRSAVQAAEFPDSVGVGSYGIDLHPSSGGDNYIDFESLPFQIPLGALLPVRVQNLIPACKNIGTTHITSGCYRLHPVEWGIGEAAGCLVSFALSENLSPHTIRNTAKRLESFQKFIRQQGVETEWQRG
jgi:hypothetical protein